MLESLRAEMSEHKKKEEMAQAELGPVMLGLEEALRLLRELREGAEQQASVVCVLECAHRQDAHACVWADWAGLYRRRGGVQRRGCYQRRGTWHLDR